MATWTDKMVLHYRDVSTGSSVASHFTGFASVRAMKPAASTALIYLGDAKSQVHVWTPNFDKVRRPVLAHFSSLQCLCLWALQ